MTRSFSTLQISGRLRERCTTILVLEQNAHAALALAAQAYAMESG